MAEPQLLLLGRTDSRTSASKLADVVFDLIGTLQKLPDSLSWSSSRVLRRILEVADRGYVMRSGEVVVSGLCLMTS